MLDSADTNADGERSLLRQLAHELRDALSPLASSADLARLRGFDAEASRLLVERVERGLHRTLAILDAFVLAERCENGTLQPETRPVALAEILQATRDELTERELERCTFMAEGGQASVCADAVRSAEVLRAVLRTLLTVAVPESAIEVGPVADGRAATIRVLSHGDARQLPRENSLTRYAGDGGDMALRTARRFMALQGGSLDLVKRGAHELELVMRFRGADAQSGAEARAVPELRSGARQTAGSGGLSHASRILIVDDSLQVRRAYRDALATLGYSVTEAADAEQALAALEGAAPDVVLIDIHLPRTNGYQLAQLIRERSGASVCLVMLSGVTLDAATRSLARKSGFDDCLDKMAGPIALRDLLIAAAARKS